VVEQTLDDQQGEEGGKEIEPARADREQGDGMGHHEQGGNDGEGLTAYGLGQPVGHEHESRQHHQVEQEDVLVRIAAQDVDQADQEREQRRPTVDRHTDVPVAVVVVLAGNGEGGGPGSPEILRRPDQARFVGKHPQGGMDGEPAMMVTTSAMTRPGQFSFTQVTTVAQRTSRAA
jgi:hypothetical protein